MQGHPFKDLILPTVIHVSIGQDFPQSCAKASTKDKVKRARSSETPQAMFLSLQ